MLCFQRQPFIFLFTVQNIDTIFLVVSTRIRNYLFSLAEKLLFKVFKVGDVASLIARCVFFFFYFYLFIFFIFFFCFACAIRGVYWWRDYGFAPDGWK